MSAYRRIRWLSNHRSIPNYGTVTEGSEVTLPVSLATAFVNQGQAEFIKEEPVKKKAKVDVDDAIKMEVTK